MSAVGLAVTGAQLCRTPQTLAWARAPYFWPALGHLELSETRLTALVSTHLPDWQPDRSTIFAIARAPTQSLGAQSGSYEGNVGRPIRAAARIPLRTALSI